MRIPLIVRTLVLLALAGGLYIAPGNAAESGWSLLPAWLQEVPAATAAAEPPGELHATVIENQPFPLLGAEVQAGEFARLTWQDQQSFSGLDIGVPVLVVNGRKPGPVLCLTAAIHGDELNGIEIVRNLMFGIDPELLNGTVVGVPIVNIHGFQRNSRYLPDRRDLNRFFPGNPNGSAASRIAHSFFANVVRSCSHLVDLHTGSAMRTNLPQLRADLNNPDIKSMAQGFGATVVLHSGGGEGTLRRAAADIGIPAVTLEAGEPMRFQPDEVSHGVRSIRSLMNHLGMDDRASFWEEPRPVYFRSSWIRADSSGILSSRVALGDQVNAGDLLGTITDPITNRRTEVRSGLRGKVLGKALGQSVMPGFALYHIGLEAEPEAPPEACDFLEAEVDGDCPTPWFIPPFEDDEDEEGLEYDG